jgi:uncharacterized protein YecE (DUF72 family)
MHASTTVKIGTAGWTVPKQHRQLFPDAGTHLSRYAQRFPAVEINSSFYRPHRPVTYERWAHSVPDHFQFSAKIPKVISHQLRLVGAEEPLAQFLQEVTALGHKLGPLLLQLPPSLELNPLQVRNFLSYFRDRFSGDIVCEPRHASWTEPAGVRLFEDFQISPVIADPPVVSISVGSWRTPIYYRLHGTPRVYYSEYTQEYLSELTSQLFAHCNASRTVWCIFDNTAIGAAAANGLDLLDRLRRAQADDNRGSMPTSD